MARISIIVMLGESSMNIGAEETSAILRASRDQSSSFIWPLRMWLSGTRASADSSRMVISERVISRLKKQLARLLWIERRAADVEAEGRVVRRDHRRAGEVQVVVVVDLDAPHRDARDLVVRR